ncbi:MAG: hypothetical protein NTV58_04395 [Deltaproteobacteria bacterium]|nr:hypothetical protein [Deltaproteobacteria bacterium]
MFSKNIVTAVLLSLLIVFSFTFVSAAEEKPAAETKVPSETAKAPAAAAAVEEKPTGDFTVSALSQYIWRGYELSRNSIVVQPSATIGYKGFSANVWGNLDTRPYFAGTGETSYPSTWNETDLTLSYTKNLGLFNLGAGYIYYSLGSLNKDAPDRADAQEIFATVSLNTILSPTLTAYKEIDHYRNWYFLLGVSHTFEFNKMVSLKLAASASYLLSTYADATLFNAGAGYGGYPKFDGNSQATNDKFSNLHDGTVTVSLPIKATGYITITPTISYVFPLSDDAKYEMKGSGMKGTATPADRDSSFIYGGLAASFSF